MDLDRFYADMMQHVQRVLPLLQRLEPMLPQIEEMVRNHGAMQARVQGIEHRVNSLPGVPQDANQAQAAMRAPAPDAVPQPEAQPAEQGSVPSQDATFQERQQAEARVADNRAIADRDVHRAEADDKRAEDKGKH